MSTIPLDLETDAVVLPPPKISSLVSFEKALKNRRSTREFLPDPLPLDTISALLWTGFGVNRLDAGGRTAPSAHNWQELDVYVVLPEGTYCYDPHAHQLSLLKLEDLRGKTGTQDFVANAPVNFVYVADFSKMAGASDEERRFLAGADAGCIAQNVYLYCAGQGLGCVVRALIDRRELAQAFGLRSTQRIVLAQSIGLPSIQT